MSDVTWPEIRRSAVLAAAYRTARDPEMPDDVREAARREFLHSRPDDGPRVAELPARIVWALREALASTTADTTEA
jgi:hypothetical protein